MRSPFLCVALLAGLATGHAFAEPLGARGKEAPRPIPRQSTPARPAGDAVTETRVALVIGNGAYVVGRLNNPVLDARAMAATLTGLGFEVLAHENLSYRDMRRAVAEFGERIANGGVGLFYYSGHGVQMNGKNYLVPVDADIKNERYVAAESIDADSVLIQMQEAKTRVNIVVLDACRNNPFAGRFRSLARGLAFMDVPAGTYVAYSTAPGSVAEDGEPGKNGIYTGELLKALREPGLRIEDVFKRVRIAVGSGGLAVTATGGGGGRPAALRARGATAGGRRAGADGPDRRRRDLPGRPAHRRNPARPDPDRREPSGGQASGARPSGRVQGLGGRGPGRSQPALRAGDRPGAGLDACRGDEEGPGSAGARRALGGMGVWGVWGAMSGPPMCNQAVRSSKIRRTSSSWSSTLWGKRPNSFTSARSTVRNGSPTRSVSNATA